MEEPQPGPPASFCNAKNLQFKRHPLLDAVAVAVEAAVEEDGEAAMGLLRTWEAANAVLDWSADPPVKVPRPAWSEDRRVQVTPLPGGAGLFLATLGPQDATVVVVFRDAEGGAAAGPTSFRTRRLGTAAGPEVAMLDVPLDEKVPGLLWGEGGVLPPTFPGPVNVLLVAAGPLSCCQAVLDTLTLASTGRVRRVFTVTLGGVPCLHPSAVPLFSSGLGTGTMVEALNVVSGPAAEVPDGPVWHEAPVVVAAAAEDPAAGLRDPANEVPLMAALQNTWFTAYYRADAPVAARLGVALEELPPEWPTWTARTYQEELGRLNLRNHARVRSAAAK